MQYKKWRRRTRLLGVICGGGAAFQVAGCDFGSVNVMQTVNANEVIAGLLRSVILTPINNWVNNAIDNVFDLNEE